MSNSMLAPPKMQRKLSLAPSKASFASYTSTGLKSVYTSKPPYEKQESGVTPLRRVASSPCTLEELLTLRYATVIAADLQRDSAGNFDFDDEFAVDEDVWDPEFRRPMLPVQATNSHLSSLRFVSDSRKFWKTYSREKMNQLAGRRTMSALRRKPISSAMTVD